MKGLFLLVLTLLGLTVMTIGAPVVGRLAEITVKREINCMTSFTDCKENKPIEECEKEELQCYMDVFGREEILIELERVCNMPAFEELANSKKRHSALKKNVDCFEEYKKCRDQYPEEEEEIPLNILTECESEAYICINKEDNESYSDILKEDGALCKMFREHFESEVPEESCEAEQEKCLKAAEGNIIGVAECEDAYVNCEFKKQNK